MSRQSAGNGVGGVRALRALTRAAAGASSQAVPKVLAALEPRPRAASAGAAATGGACEMCAEPIGSAHGHVADLQERRLLCTCRGCYLLFTGRGAGGNRYRAVPTRSRRVHDARITSEHWAALQIPVGLAFLFRQHGAPGFTAFYPGPSGATESLLDLGSWDEVLRANPVLEAVQQDVEAILLRRVEGGTACYLVPIDRCYELVGLVRRQWAGLSGGAEVWSAIDEFFADLDRRSTILDRTGDSHA